MKEIAQIKKLKKEHVRIRTLLSRYHNKYVWQTEAFLAYACNDNNLQDILTYLSIVSLVHYL